MNPEVFEKTVGELEALSNEELWELLAKIRQLLVGRGEII